MEGVGVPGLPGRCVCDGDFCDGVVCDGVVWLGVVWLGVEELGGCVPCWGGRVGVETVCVGRSVHCTDATRFAGVPGQSVEEQLKSKELKEGAEVTLTVDREDGGPVIKAIRLGKRAGAGKPANPGRTAEGGKTSVGLKPQQTLAWAPR